MKAIIVGSGISGATAAFILKQRGYDVEIFETRPHIAGNCYDVKKNGITVHKYGAHGFHTNLDRIWNFINQFGPFNNWCAEVVANTKEGIIPIPFNDISQEIVGEKTKDQIIDLLFRDYSEKMWGKPWEELPSEITARIKKRRTGTSPCYHSDKYCGVPKYGYTDLFNNMLEGIKVHLNCAPHDWRKQRYDLLVYTGKIDEYFHYSYGRLGYRSLIFQWEKAKKQKVFQVNECNKDNNWMRLIDHSYYYDNSNVEDTIIHKEYSCAHTPSNEPFYPENFGENPIIYKKYNSAAKSQSNVIFTGRLATYKYIDLDTAVAQTMNKLNYGK
jgi:UDP-galactopyranose mutase